MQQSSKLAIYDDYAKDAVKSASPYPEVPADLMAMRPGSTGVSISVKFLYSVTQRPTP